MKTSFRHAPRRIENCPRRLRSFAADEEGSATIEFALWLPLFCLMLLMTADLSLLLLKQADMWDIARDTARRIAIYEMSSEEAETYAAERVTSGSNSLVVEAEDGDEVSVLISMSTAEVVPFGVFSQAMNGTVGARVTMLKEPI